MSSFDILGSQFESSGRSIWRTICPDCSPGRHRSNVNLPVLSWSRGDLGSVYHCHHCGSKGVVLPPKDNYRNVYDYRESESEVIDLSDLDFLFDTDPPVPAVVIDPIPAPPTVEVKPERKLMQQHLDYLLRRGISEETANLGRLSSTRKFLRSGGGDQEVIAFPFYDLDGNLASSKYRSSATKAFAQDTGAGGLLYGLHQKFDTTRPLVICEGEMDSISVAQAGIPNWVSVPAGAPVKAEKGNSQRFSWIAELEEFLGRFSMYVLCVDADTPGKNLGEELARRLGRSRCMSVAYPSDSKDANDVLVKHGQDVLRQVLLDARPIPLTALHTADHYADQVMDLFIKGDGRGESTGFAGVDQLYTVARGQMTVVTGIPSSGKSNFLDQIMVNLAHREGWKFAIASMENEPAKHISKLSEMHIKKPFYNQWPGSMSKAEAQAEIAWCHKHFTFIDFASSRELPTVDAMLDRANAAVLRYGVDGLVIDPYNCLDLGRNQTQSETESVSLMLSKVSAFAKASNVHVWFVAHPAKMMNQGTTPIVPGGYEISGSAHWYNKTDCGLTVHRKDQDGYVELHVWKCRFKWVGKQGMTRLKYDIPTGTYYEII